ncbi:MAG: hypothetical protein ACUVRS_03505 [Armatimonadota bacterium]
MYRLSIVIICAIVLTASVAFAVPTGELVTDIIVGRGNRGPYTLSWTKIEPSSVTVIVNGITLKRGEHYNVDCEKGLISFNSAVKNDAIVRISYAIIPGKSERNTGKLSVPVSLSVFQRQDASLQVTGLYVQDNPKNPDSGKTLVGIGGEKRWGQTKLLSQFYVSQQGDEKSGGQGSSSDRSAFKVSTESYFGSLKVFGNLVHAGQSFAGGRETGLGQGKKVTEMGVVFSPDSRLEASSRFQQLADSTALGSKSVLQEHKVVVKPTDETKIVLTHTSTETAQSNTERAVESTSLNLEHKLSESATAALSAVTSTTVTNGSSEKTQSQQLTIATEKTVTRVAMQEKETDASGKTAETDVSIVAKPLATAEIKGRVLTTQNPGGSLFQREVSVVTKPVEFARVEAGFTQKGSSQEDDVTKQVRLELTPAPNTQLVAGYRYIETGSRVMTIKDYVALTRPVKFITFSANVRQREAKLEDAPDTATVQVTFEPFKYFTLTGSYQSNPEDTRGQVQAFNATNLGVKFKVGSVGIATEYTTKEEYLASRSADEARIDLRFPAFGDGVLTTGFRTFRLLDGSLLSSNTYSLGYTRKLGSNFSFSLTAYYTQYVKDRAVLPDKTEYSAEASLGVRF